MPGHQVLDHQLEPRKRERRGKERMPEAVHALFANVQQGTFFARGEPFAQIGSAYAERHARPGRDSRMSACAGKMRQAPSPAS